MAHSTMTYSLCRLAAPAIAVSVVVVIGSAAISKMNASIAALHQAFDIPVAAADGTDAAPDLFQKMAALQKALAPQT